MASGYFITGITTGNLVNLVRRNGIGGHPRYTVRFLYLLFCSLGTSVLAKLERALYGKEVKHAPCPRDPVFIVGHWRSGTTLLHQLFNAMPGFIAPSMLQIGTPDSFLVSDRVLPPVIRGFIPERRNTDNVRFGLDEPQEDEYAIFRSTTISPVERLIFPEPGEFFIKDGVSFLPGGNNGNGEEWERMLRNFCTKLVFRNPGRVVLKNPFHSMRIPRLRRLFPEAKFIHIHRNPLDVIPSTIRMWSIEGRYNTLRDGFRPPSLDEAITLYDRMLAKIRRDLAELPRSECCEMRFEDLEKDPPGMTLRACRSIGIGLSKHQVGRLRELARSLRAYRKNRYRLPPEKRERIRTRLKHYMDE